MRTAALKIGIVDDHSLFRKALKKYLSQQENLHIVLEASSIKGLLTDLAKTSLDLLLFDYFYPGTDGMDALKFIRGNYPHVKIIVVSQSTDLNLINELLDNGIHGYISKCDDPESLLQAIQSASENKLYRNKLFTDALYWNRQAREKSVTGKKEISFDDREKKILQMLWEEKNNKEIADEFVLSVRSIEKIRQDMKEKIEVKSTIGLLKYALLKNIIHVTVNQVDNVPYY